MQNISDSFLLLQNDAKNDSLYLLNYLSHRLSVPAECKKYQLIKLPLIHQQSSWQLSPHPRKSKSSLGVLGILGPFFKW